MVRLRDYSRDCITYNILPLDIILDEAILFSVPTTPHVLEYERLWQFDVCSRQTDAFGRKDRVFVWSVVVIAQPIG